MFCANYKVGEGFEFIKELGVKDEQQIDFEIHALEFDRSLRLEGFTCAL